MLPGSYPTLQLVTQVECEESEETCSQEKCEEEEVVEAPQPAEPAAPARLGI